MIQGLGGGKAATVGSGDVPVLMLQARADVKKE